MIQRLQPGPGFPPPSYTAALCTFQARCPNTLNADVATQTREILAKIDRLLAEAGSDKGRLLNVNVWLADIITFDQMNQVWEAWLLPGQAPARATVEARIANPGYRVEIAAIAAV